MSISIASLNSRYRNVNVISGMILVHSLTRAIIEWRGIAPENATEHLIKFQSLMISW